MNHWYRQSMTVYISVVSEKLYNIVINQLQVSVISVYLNTEQIYFPSLPPNILKQQPYQQSIQFFYPFQIVFSFILLGGGHYFHILNPYLIPSRLCRQGVKTFNITYFPLSFKVNQICFFDVVTITLNRMQNLPIWIYIFQHEYPVIQYSPTYW